MNSYNRNGYNRNGYNGNIHRLSTGKVIHRLSTLAKSNLTCKLFRRCGVLVNYNTPTPTLCQMTPAAPDMLDKKHALI